MRLPGGLTRDFALAALPLIVAHVGLLATWDLAARPTAFVFWCAAAFLALIAAVRRLAGISASKTVGILSIAALLRLLLLPLPPTLSDDVYRYVWDGRIANEGLDPYRVAPDDSRLEPLRDELWERLPHRQVPTVYPPLAMSLFSIAARFSAPVLTLKLALVLLDLLTCALLLRIAASYGIAQERVVWYAWNPLAVLEVAGMGHVDALGGAAAVLTVFLLTSGRRRAIPAALAAAAAVLAKLIPLVALPAWSRLSGRWWLFLALAIAVSGAFLAPMALAGGGIPGGFLAFGVSWEFNGPLFEPLWRLYDGIGVERWISDSLDRIKIRTGEHDFWNRFYPFNYPQFLAKLTLGLAMLVQLARVSRHRHPVVATGLVFATVLVFSATVYPWYLLWVLPWAALCRQPAWLYLSFGLLLSYLPQTTDLALLPWLFLVIWAPFAALLFHRPKWSIV